MNDNTKLFIFTIDMLARCNTSYKSMSQSIHKAIDNNLSIIDRLNEELPKFNSPFDVVEYIQGQ